MESDFGQTASNIFQLEEITFNWIREKFGAEYGFSDSEYSEIETDIELAILVARLRYPNPIPKSLTGQARHWKRHYNTRLGKGRSAEFVRKYRRYADARYK